MHPLTSTSAPALPTSKDADPSTNMDDAAPKTRYYPQSLLIASLEIIRWRKKWYDLYAVQRFPPQSANPSLQISMAQFTRKVHVLQSISHHRQETGHMWLQKYFTGCSCGISSIFFSLVYQVSGLVSVLASSVLLGCPLPPNQSAADIVKYLLRSCGSSRSTCLGRRDVCQWCCFRVSLRFIVTSPASSTLLAMYQQPDWLGCLRVSKECRCRILHAKMPLQDIRAVIKRSLCWDAGACWCLLELDGLWLWTKGLAIGQHALSIIVFTVAGCSIW